MNLVEFGWIRVELELRPLADRRENIPVLVQYFLNQAVQHSTSSLKNINVEGMELIIGAPLPGNLRQLQNVIEQGIALSH